MPAPRTLLGLASPARVRQLTERLAAAERRTAELKAAIDKAREEAKHWKAKASELSAKIAKLEKAVERLPRVERELADAKARVEQLRGLKQAVARAERNAALGQEHLLATETKLDIIEGALNILDARTRT